MVVKAVLNKIANEIMDKYRGLPKDFAGHIAVGKGASGSDTSKIDKFAEDAVFEFLDREDVKINVLSEEIGFVDRGGDKVLILDPIDGTVNCVRGIPFFSISMAVATKSMSDADHALVKNLYTGDTYYARRGGGAELNGHRITVSKYNRDDSVFLMFDGRDTAPVSAKVKELATRVRTMGCASLEMCLVAQGAVQAHYMNCLRHERKIRIVDIAASTLILREAGGEVCDLKGKRLDMELTLDDRRNFLAYGDPSIKELIL
ncbi:MAG: hypothetical protein MUO84_02330 [Thermoplasmata archaeon]|nr:hypothetical protein [Thermoplasmata archaeon]